MNVWIEASYFSQWPHLQHPYPLNSSYTVYVHNLVNIYMTCSLVYLFLIRRGTVAFHLQTCIMLTISTWWRSETLHKWLSFWKVPSSSLLRGSSVTRVKQSALIGLLSILTAVSSEVCMCACPVRYPVLVLSLFCRQEKAEECQPASTQLLHSYWYSGHTEPSWVSVARAKEECGKWGDGERRRRGVRAPSFSCYVDLKIDSILPSSLFPVHLCFHSQRPSLVLSLSVFLSSLSSSSLSLCLV